MRDYQPRLIPNDVTRRAASRRADAIDRGVLDWFEGHYVFDTDRERPGRANWGSVAALEDASLRAFVDQARRTAATPFEELDDDVFDVLAPLRETLGVNAYADDDLIDYEPLARRAPTDDEVTVIEAYGVDELLRGVLACLECGAPVPLRTQRDRPVRHTCAACVAKARKRRRARRAPAPHVPKTRAKTKAKRAPWQPTQRCAECGGRFQSKKHATCHACRQRARDAAAYRATLRPPEMYATCRGCGGTFQLDDDGFLPTHEHPIGVPYVLQPETRRD